MNDSSVTRYYDANTRRFLRYGHGGSQVAIHRAVWAEGVAARADAMNYINMRAAERVRAAGAGSLVDIGCGVGGSLIYLAERSGIRADGITVSAVQQRIGGDLLAERGLSDRCRIFTGDFLEPADRNRIDGRPYDIALAVESFIHMPDGGAFFRAASELLAPGGELLLCDDFLTDDFLTDDLLTEDFFTTSPSRQDTTSPEPQQHPHPGSAARHLSRFREGWHAAGLTGLEDTRSMAAEAGLRLEADEDLTPFLELDRPRDRLIRVLVGLTAPLPLKAPFWRNLRGGDALQHLLSSRLLSYRLLRFRQNP